MANLFELTKRSERGGGEAEREGKWERGGRQRKKEEGIKQAAVFSWWGAAGTASDKDMRAFRTRTLSEQPFDVVSRGRKSIKPSFYFGNGKIPAIGQTILGTQTEQRE